MKYAAFPAAAVVGIIGIVRDRSKWLAIVSTLAAAVLSFVVYL